MGHCKDCKFWQKNYVTDEGMYCDRVNHWMPKSDHECEISWYASDDQGLTMELATHPMFGCVNFEGKEASSVSTK
jgi:hypothetical protein